MAPEFLPFVQWALLEFVAIVFALSVVIVLVQSLECLAVLIGNAVSCELGGPAGVFGFTLLALVCLLIGVRFG